MASESRVIDLEDNQHPLHQATIQNETSLFLRLPKEVRIMIYEFAVFVDKPIEPRQVTNRSNKFVWGIHPNLFGPDSYGSELAVTQLAQVCRQIYRDLEDCPVFYRVNRFHFGHHDELHKFLVAITPTRRSMIRRITLETSDCNRKFILGGSRGTKKEHYLTMLYECVDLRELIVILKMPMYLPNMENFLTNFLQVLRVDAIKKPMDKPSVWNLPDFKLQLEFGTWILDMENLVSRTSVPSRFSYLNREPVSRNISQFVAALKSRRQRLLEEQKKQGVVGMKSIVKSGSLQEAITAAKIDFPGEDRVTLDIKNSSAGAVSSRTRYKCAATNHDTKTGTIKRNLAKYNTEGLVTYPMNAINQVRWNHSVIEGTIECEVIWRNAWANEPIDNSWEKLDAVLTEHGVFLLAKFYREMIGEARKRGDASTRLEKLRSVPSPKDITDFSHGFLSGWIQENTKLWNSYVGLWEHLKLSFKLLETRLEKKVTSDNQKKASKRDPKKQ